jgi:hypothetical protein
VYGEGGEGLYDPKDCVDELEFAQLSLAWEVGGWVGGLVDGYTYV